MRDKKLDHLIQQLETYLECWKQFNRFVGMTRANNFGPDDEQQFLEVKSVIVQELESILAAIESGTPGREETHSLITATPSLRHIAEMNEAGFRSLENSWHKLYINWHSVLGQIKVQRNQLESTSPLTSFLSKRRK